MEPAGHLSRLTGMSDQALYTVSGVVLLFAAAVLVSLLQI